MAKYPMQGAVSYGNRVVYIVGRRLSNRYETGQFYDVSFKSNCPLPDLINIPEKYLKPLPIETAEPILAASLNPVCFGRPVLVK